MLCVFYFKHFVKPENLHKTTQKRQLYNIKKLNQKLVMENAITVQSNKGKTTVIINAEEYSKKVHTFITDNNFHLIQKDPTTKYQQLIHRTLQQCNLIIDKQEKDKIPNTTKTITTNFKSTTKTAQNRYTNQIHNQQSESPNIQNSQTPCKITQQTHHTQ